MSIWQVENSWKFFQTVIICHPLHILNAKVNSNPNSKEATTLRFSFKNEKEKLLITFKFWHLSKDCCSLFGSIIVNTKTHRFYIWVTLCIFAHRFYLSISPHWHVVTCQGGFRLRSKALNNSNIWTQKGTQA
jgi:hypothetical protein